MRKAEKATKPGSELEDPFRDENFQILHCLQSSLMNTSLLSHTEADSLLSPLHQLLTHETYGHPCIIKNTLHLN